MEDEHLFARLSQDAVIDAVESLGHTTDLRVFPLNSYENRVYQVGLEGEEPIIAKFYRPERWSDEQILEEHRLSAELAEAEIPVIPPIVNRDGTSLFNHKDFRFSLYLRRGGHAPALDDMDSLYQMGQLLGRIHMVGAVRPFEHRPELNVDNFGDSSREFLLANFIPGELERAYDTLTRDLLSIVRQRFEQVQAQNIRVHGDCHVGNILCRDGAIHFVDLDDSRMAPAMQDIWMFLSGDRDTQTRALGELVEGYNEFADFNPRELPLLEALRTLRIMHYSAWLARRWSDPAFPRTFTWFNTDRYWSEHILQLREQLALLQEPPLAVW